jgi:hypothetical protein
MKGRGSIRRGADLRDVGALRGVVARLLVRLHRMQFALGIAGKSVPSYRDPAYGHDEHAADQSREKHNLYQVSGGKKHKAGAIAREVVGFPARRSAKSQMQREYRKDRVAGIVIPRYSCALIQEYLKFTHKYPQQCDG